MKNLIAFAVSLFMASAFAADIGPDDLVKKTSEDVLAVVKRDKDIQAGNRAKIFALVDEKVLPHFDFNRMTRLAMGRNWNKASPEQQQALVKQFRDLLVRTYAVSLSEYRDQKINYRPTQMKPDDTDVTVKTEIVQSAGQNVPLDYDMYKTPQGWKVYNIVVGGVSLVTNYRSEFNNLIQQSGVDGLIRTLVAKNSAGQADLPASKQ